MKAILLLFLATAPFLSAEPVRDKDNPYIIVCSDGHRVRVTPFNQSATDAFLCGEEAQQPTGPVIPDGFVQIYGEHPTSRKTGLTGVELQTARQEWAIKLSEFMGVVEMPKEADAAAKKAARYGLGNPVFFLSSKGDITWEDDGVVVKEGVLVAFPESVLASAQDLGIYELGMFLLAPDVIIARIQLSAADRGLVIPSGVRHPFASF
jgi:hypothetical protein